MACPDGNTRWTLFGPITGKDDSSKWPGKIGFSPLPMDGATAIPRHAVLPPTCMLIRQAAKPFDEKIVLPVANDYICPDTVLIGPGGNEHV